MGVRDPETRRVQRRSMKADIERAKKDIAKKVDATTMQAAWDAHIAERHYGHNEDFSQLCYMCLVLIRRRKRAKRIEQHKRAQP